MSEQLIEIGDRVRTPQGRTDWTVTRLGVSFDLPVAWMRNAAGGCQRYRFDRLRFVGVDER